ncbi:MAG: hypothetical protein GY870_06185 [archaeon]|nr:hypothetical protein [archaeon]
MGTFEEEMEKIGKNKPLKIMFVCSGNICRSAYADFAFRNMVEKSEILKEKILVESGALTFKNTEIDERTTQFLLEENVGFTREEIQNHKPRFKDDHPDMFEKVDIIVGMTKGHKFATPKRWRRGPEAKFRQLSELAIDEKIDIGDPYWVNEYSEYEAILNHVKEYLIILKNKLEDFYRK